MKENQVIKIAYQTIKKALEWGTDNDNSGYAYANYVEGVVGMTDALLEEMSQTKEENIIDLLKKLSNGSIDNVKKSFSEVGISIINDDGTFKTINEVFYELSKIY